MKNVVLVACLGALSIPVTASAAVTVSIDMDLSTAGIQAQRIASDGETFDVGIVLTLTGSSTLAGYDFSIRMDDNELDFVSFTKLVPVGWESNFNPSTTFGSNDAGLGDGPFVQLNPIEAVDFDLADVLTAGEFTIATMQLTVGAAFTDGFVDILPGLYDASNTFADGGAADITSDVVFNGGTITAVPEPGTWAVLGLASAGMALRRMRRGKVAA